MFRVTEHDLSNIVKSSLMAEESKRHFLEIVNCANDSLAHYTHSVLCNYAENYQSLVDTPLTIENYNAIYSRFEKLDSYLSSDTEYQGLDVKLVYPIDTAVSHACEITDGFSSYLHDDMYTLMSEISDSEMGDVVYATQEEEDRCYLKATETIADRLETVVDMTKYIVSELESIILPLRDPDVGVPVFFTMRNDSLLVFIGS